MTQHLKAPPFGQFLGDVVTEWLDDDRMLLCQDFTYIGPDGTRWPVPQGVTVDGASIPRLLWTLVGAPLNGRYRKASVIHDYFCITRDRPWRSVHRMFYYAMRASNVSVVCAATFFVGVYCFGPRWRSRPLQSANEF